jgi:hypothetical protein
MPVIGVSLSPEVQTQAKQMAQMVGVSLSEYIRILVINDTHRLRQRELDAKPVTPGVENNG